MLRSASLLPLSAVALCFAINPARAQYFTNHDGYTGAGQYRLQVELSPYLWLPATSGSFSFAHSAIQDRASGNFGSSVPSLGSLASSLHFSFMGDGLLRYGPYSTELDIQYVSGSSSETVATPLTGGENRLHLNASYVRIAPGLGYQVYSGNVFSVPTSVDARAGFSYFESWRQLKGEGNLTGEAGNSGNFVQPWVGTRIDFVPSPHWRIDVNALAQGMGIANGSWGWAASGVISYAVNDWFDVDAGYSAINSQRNQGSGNTPGAPKRSLELNAYGPVFGVSFRFGGSSPPLPAPTPAPIAAPAPAPARTYLVFFGWDSTALTPRAAQIIAQAASDSQGQAVTTINVNGYTDTSGTPAYNKGLSVRRAQAVETRLIADGVPESEITVLGLGDTHLLVPTGPGVREPQNRRVEIVLQ